MRAATLAPIAAAPAVPPRTADLADLSIISRNDSVSLRCRLLPPAPAAADVAVAVAVDIVVIECEIGLLVSRPESLLEKSTQEDGPPK